MRVGTTWTARAQRTAFRCRRRAAGRRNSAPAPGVAIAAWKANWGWGEEGALLIRHTREELGLTHGARYSFSEFDHLRYDAVGAYGKGKVVKRGDVLGTVFRPGGKARYFPEVHWEVWEVEDDTEMSWPINKYKGAY